MQSNQSTTRIKILTEMGIGPVWLPRYTEVAKDTIEISVADDANAVLANAASAVEDAQTIVPARGSDLVAEIQAIDAASLEDGSPAWFDEHPASDGSTMRSPSSASSAARGSVSDMTWDVLEETVSSCRACGLCEGRQKTVFGVGERTASWLFVGEGPGYHENLHGEPFVGAAGQLLDNMLLSLGVRRGDRAYIANVVKCRPTDHEGKDRPPTADEIASCLPYLQRQIALIQPQVIVALGKTAAIALSGSDPETPVTQLRNKVHRVAGVPMVATYHPAYLLRKPLEKSKAWQDLCLAQRALDGRSV